MIEAAQEMIGVTQKFCAQMAAVQFSELTKKATDEAKRGVLDGLGCALAQKPSRQALIVCIIWTKVSLHAHLIMSRMRGHVRRDPQLGTLIRDVEAEDGEGDFRVRDRTVEILIDGKKEPDPVLVARARELVADFDNFELRLNDYLAQAAKD